MDPALLAAMSGGGGAPPPDAGMAPGMPMGGMPPGMPMAPAPPMMGGTPAGAALPLLAMLAPQQAQQAAALHDQQVQSMMMMLAQSMQGQGNPVGAAAGSEPMLPPQDGSMIDPTQDPTMDGL